MSGIYLTFFGLAILGLLGFARAWQARRAGRIEEKAQAQEKVLDNADKAKNTLLTLDDDRIERLRKRYPRVRLLPRDPP